MGSIANNLSALKSELPQSVTLVAVSKTKPLAMITEAYNAGHRDFGENYVQELDTKAAELPRDIRWHFIGHLQSNKVKYIAPFVYLIHGVDSVKLLAEINKQGAKAGRTIDCLLQLYVASEETKFGLDFNECRQILEGTGLKEMKNVRVKGFMAMASNTEDENKIRKEFRSVKSFAGQVEHLFPPNPILSFGMSSDYRIAVQEGSTMVRVGSLIFGERDYSQR